jgi:hypothetical protein
VDERAVNIKEEEVFHERGVAIAATDRIRKIYGLCYEKNQPAKEEKTDQKGKIPQTSSAEERNANPPENRCDSGL